MSGCCGSSSNPEMISAIEGDHVVTLPNGTEMRFADPAQAEHVATAYNGTIASPEPAPKARTSRSAKATPTAEPDPIEALADSAT